MDLPHPLLSKFERGITLTAAGALALLGTDLSPRERAEVAFYGVRGIGSVYYLGYATTHIDFINKEALWALVVFTIFASTLIHGLTAAEAVRVLVREDMNKN